MMDELKQHDFDSYSGKLFCLFMILNATNLLVKQSLSIVFLTNNITMILGIVYIVYFAFHFSIFRSAILEIVILEIGFIVLMGISILNYPNASSAIVKRCIWTLAFCIPLFCVGKKVEDHDLFFSQAKKGCIYVLIIAAFQFLRHTGVDSSQFDYDVSTSYALVFPTIFHISRLKEKKIYYLLIILELAIILLYGSRGPLLCVGSYILIRIILTKPKSAKAQLLKIMVIFLIIFSVVGYEQVINIISDISKSLGISSRTISLLTRSKISYNSGRDDLWEMVIDKIKEKPYLGWGVAGDQSFMVSYPHQLFLELVLHFGIIIGSFLGLWIVYKIMKKIITVRFQDKALVAFLCTGFIPLMLSDTYLDNVYFWLLMAFCGGLKINFTIRGSS